MKYRYTRKEIAFAMKFAKREVPHGLTQTEAYDLANLLLATKKTKKAPNSGGVKSGKNQDDECTAGPYCKCEDCRNYEGDLPIDRL